MLEYRERTSLFMATDLEIAHAASPAPIEEIAWKIGIGVDELIPMGRGMAKITWDGLKSKFEATRGAYVLITSVNPTPFGEGKTVTTIGLTQALNRIGQNATCTLREPSMGPVFGIKGGAAGGETARYYPWKPSISTLQEICMPSQVHTTYARQCWTITSILEMNLTSIPIESCGLESST